jgi:hypothetical protein
MAANPDAGSAYASSYAAPKACEGQVSQFKTCMDQNEVSFPLVVERDAHWKEAIAME